MIRGRQLESAMGLGALHYQRAGRADIRHNATPTGRRADGSMYYRQKADADFSGAIENGSYKAEAKEVHADRFDIFNPKSGLKPHQRAALERAAKLGAISGVVIGFLGRSPWEVYFVSIVELAPFLDKPWRQSLSIDMCRAWGVLLPLGVTAGGKPFVRFLDGTAHPDKDAAITRVNAEKLAQPAGELFSSEEKPKKVSPRIAKLLGGIRKEDYLLDLAKTARRKGLRTGMWGTKK